MGGRPHKFAVPWRLRGRLGPQDGRSKLLGIYETFHGSPTFSLQELILAVPPAVPISRGRPFFLRAHYELLGRHVDGLSVMTYDASTPQAPGADPHVCNFCDARGSGRV